MAEWNDSAYIQAYDLGYLTAKPNRRYASGRVCACGVVLSRYNAQGTCWDHTPLDKRLPRVRGKRADAKV